MLRDRSIVKLVVCIPSFFTAVFALFILCGCENGAVDRPDGWAEETHGNTAAANYDVVFDQHAVKRIDLIFAPWDWQVMINDITELCGGFGMGSGMGIGDMPDGMGPPEETLIPCEGLMEGDSCLFTREGFSMEGVCTGLPFMEGRLVCLPEMFEPCEGLQDGDPCLLRGTNGAEVDGTCTSIPFMELDLMCMPEGVGGIPDDMALPSALDLLERDPVYRPCTFLFEGTTWQHVGVRFKGNSSLQFTWGAGSFKLPMRFDFDEFEDVYPEIEDQRFFGFKKLTMSSSWSDNSLTREKTVADIFREAGVPAPATAFYRLFINYGLGPIYFGLYTMVEDPDGPMLDTQFNDGSGNLYKPAGSGADFVRFDEQSFVKKTNEEDADWSDVIAVFEALHADRSDPEIWRDGLEAVLDVNGFLLWMAVNTVVTNWDTYGNLAHNYYLYTDPDAGLMSWIPWDNNMALVSGFAIFEPFPFDLSIVGENWPLIRFLMDDPVYRGTYRFFVNETVGGSFETEKTRERFQQAHEAIAPYVTGPEGEQAGYTLLAEPGDFNTALESLLLFAAQRREEALQFLSDEGFVSSPVVIHEIHYNPASSPADEYEFIELVNAGDRAVDISGYAFTAGIDFVFPRGTSIGPGEYMLVCEHADACAGKASQVFEWTGGKLSNQGEALVLRDAAGIIADYVRYDDRGYWPAEADGGGMSLELKDAASVNSLAENWCAGHDAGGTPGQQNSCSVRDTDK